MSAEFEIVASSIKEYIGCSLTDCSIAYGYYRKYVITGTISSIKIRKNYHYTRLKPLNCAARKLVREIEKKIKCRQNLK